MARGQGLTTEQLVIAIDRAMAGDAIQFMTMGPTGYYSDLARFLAKQKGIGYTFNGSTNTLTFGGLGRIKFRRGEDHPPCRELEYHQRRGELIWDHAVPFADVRRATRGVQVQA